MNRNEIESAVNEIMVEDFEVEPTALRPEALLGKDLGLDSLDGVDLMVALEKTFHCRISEEEGRAVRTLRDVYEKIESRLPVAGGGAGVR